MTDLPAGIDQGALDAATTEAVDAAVPAEAEVQAEVQAEPEPPTGYGGWLKADLVAEAESRGLDTSGTKEDLIARLSE